MAGPVAAAPMRGGGMTGRARPAGPAVAAGPGEAADARSAAATVGRDGISVPKRPASPAGSGWVIGAGPVAAATVGQGSITGPAWLTRSAAAAGLERGTGTVPVAAAIGGGGGIAGSG